LGAIETDLKTRSLAAEFFIKVAIQLECKLSSEQAKLVSVLQNRYRVTLEHSGTSYYKYLDDIYQISSDKPIEISYSFKEDRKGIPVNRNNVWDKMVRGDIILSPYSSWVVKVETLPTVSPDRSLLEKFNDVKHLINVSLTGEGSYVDLSKVSGDLQLQKYYQKIDLSESLEDSMSQKSIPQMSAATNLAKMGLFSTSQAGPTASLDEAGPSTSKSSKKSEEVVKPLKLKEKQRENGVTARASK
jgi:hypothetical protein